MKKRKICVIITARPSYSRVRTALKAIQQHPELELQLVVAASALLDRYGSTVNFIESDGFHIAEKVYMVIEGATLTSSAKTTGIGIMELATTFDNLKPRGCTTGQRRRSRVHDTRSSAGARPDREESSQKSEPKYIYYIKVTT